MREADFGNPEVLNEINDFVKNNTNGLIPEILDKLIGVFVLANAFYFKGSWKNQFKEISEKISFKNTDGTISQVDMMKVECLFKYIEDPLGQYIEIPYLGNATMTIFLPKNNNTSTDQRIKEYRTKESFHIQMRKNKINKKLTRLILPKFKLKRTIHLTEPLKRLGVAKLFGEKADLSGISENRLYVSNAIHKAYLEVNTNGTEAAAVSTLEVELASMPIDPELMIVNRPFIFDIYDEVNDLHLFTGKINKL